MSLDACTNVKVGAIPVAMDASVEKTAKSPAPEVMPHSIRPVYSHQFETPWVLHTISRLEKRATPVRLHIRLWLDERWGTLAHSRNDYGEPAGLVWTKMSGIGKGVANAYLYEATWLQVGVTSPQLSGCRADGELIDV